MSQEHLTIETIRAWRNGKLAPGEVIAVARHLASCSDCADLGTRELSLPRSAAALRAQIEGDSFHPDVEGELFAYTDGTLPLDRRVAVEEHLAHCARCRQDVDDLRGLGAARKWALPRWALGAAAALAAVVVTSLLLFDRVTPALVTAPPAVITAQPGLPVPSPAVRTPEPPAYGRSDWGELVRAARSGKPMPMPEVLKKIRRKADILRGSSSPPRDTPFAPVGVVLETQRPTFTWPAPAGARSTVSLFAGPREVARSKQLATTTWTPPRDLPRGVTYTWEVEVSAHGEPQILPAPPAPPAQFHIVDAATLAELDAAARDHPDDHLLLGLLYARAGLDDRARAELSRVDAPQDVVTARRVLRELETWRPR